MLSVETVTQVNALLGWMWHLSNNVNPMDWEVRQVGTTIGWDRIGASL